MEQTRFFQDREGNLWFGTWNGATRYDGQTFKTVSLADGLIDKNVWTMFQDLEGNIWFGTSNGLSRYDGKAIANFTTLDGLPDNEVNSILQDQEGTLWFGTEGGVSRFDGKTFTNLTTQDGLADNEVESVFQDREGLLWFGTEGGVSRYDGKTFRNFTTQDGLGGNDVRAIFQDREGLLWFGIWGGGLSCYDGRVFQTITREDGLASNSVVSILQDRNGDLWLANPNKGVTRYRPRTAVSPSVFVDAFVADRRYEGASELEMEYDGGLTTFEFHGISFKTRPAAMVYRYRLKGHDPVWKTTRDRRVEYQGLSPGAYTFEVHAVGRDLIYSTKPAMVSLQVHLPYTQIAWGAALSIALAMIAVQAVRIAQRGKKLHASNEALQETHDTLESHVEERTRALHRTNTRLEAEITERKRTERELIGLERLRALGELSAGISHNLNNILTGIMGPALVLRSQVDDPNTVREADGILRAARRAADLVRRLHNAVRGRDEADLVAVDVNRIVREAVQDARPRWKDEAESKGITIEVGTEFQEVPTIRGTVSGLHDIVINLLFNAIDAMPEGGRIDLLTAIGEMGVQLVVKDTGCGMDLETRERIFEPFFTTKMDVGTGLGLSTVYGVVSRWGGRIDVESEPERGTSFIVDFPRWEGPEFVAEDLPETVRSRCGRILLVDDDDGVRDFLSAFLSQEHSVDVFRSGSEALDHFTPGRYDVAFIDLSMPDVPGDEVAKRMKQMDKALSTVLITGWELDRDDPRLRRFDFRIQKPIEDLDQIRDKAGSCDESTRRAQPMSLRVLRIRVSDGKFCWTCFGMGAILGERCQA